MRFKSLTILVGLCLLLVSFIVPAPPGISDAAWRATGLASAMALWWLTEALPLAATALLPLAVAPLLGLGTLDAIARSYGDPLIILFLGGFLLARAIERSGLHQRLAGALLGYAGTSAHRVLGAVMLTTAFLSLWISNTASAMVVAPVAASIAASQKHHPEFGTALMLGVAFSATIGGMGSLIGTPPNAIFAAYVWTTYGVHVGFAQWAAVGVSVALVLLAIAWVMLSWVSPRLRPEPLTMSFGNRSERMTSAERRVALIAGITALGWLSRPVLEWLFPMIALSDAGVAMIAALVLFMTPSGDGNRLLDWKAAETLRWDVLILFGGGLALADILQISGLAGWIGGNVRQIAHLPELAILLIVAGLIVYVGELASNTAMAAIFLPVAGAMAVTLGVDPVSFMLPVALAASIGFMLPVATPPNAIVFANPAVTRVDMLRAGAPLDLIALFVAVGGGWCLAPLVFG